MKDSIDLAPSSHRLTKTAGDYCSDECGQARSCRRLDDAKQNDDLSLRCKDALRYERLREYEDTGLLPTEIEEIKRMLLLFYTSVCDFIESKQVSKEEAKRG